SRDVTAGSMRGFGTLQIMTALEVLIDEIASALPLDSIELRRRNALKPGGRTMTGNPYSVSVRTPEILDKLERHPIWQQRGHDKAGAQQAGKLIGSRPRVGSSLARPGDRSAASAYSTRAAQGHGGSGDDSRCACTSERHL